MVELRQVDVEALATRAPIAEFVFMLLTNFLDLFEFKSDANWEHFTGTWLPKQASAAGISPKQPIPLISAEGSPREIKNQVEQVMHWSYLHGLFCRAYEWLDMQFEGKRG